MKRIPNVNTFADLIDRLMVEILKLSVFENRKSEEQVKRNPDAELIMKWDRLSREACELRSALKNEINKLLSEIVNTGTYEVMREPRTFKSSSKSISDILEEMCGETARNFYNNFLAETIELDLLNKLENQNK